ncbi:MAG TPA: cobaltochelatase subunit CobN [Methylomusa anaerophila]|uniref:Aerobic cobaltochelatase subunit CobN n=1 Tax=Methylomusa anaerophila TaxID=1930071 RepID=A0A348AEA1_9FIRM|nr:cobaltochelatase subunit CobN [Methylomusa anaerophila]BBB89399.1 aerobic cobaltochelatase subunit CobN [Methylomusa anaerophila]HML90476.1 cobaltochelatase subunit CobN [Methylomusa anaerophila]
MITNEQQDCLVLAHNRQWQNKKEVMKMKIASIMWGSYMQALVAAAREIDGLELKIYSMKDMGEAECREAFFRYARQEADVLVIYANANAVWEAMSGDLKEISTVIPVVVFGNAPALLVYNTVPGPVALTVQQYLTYGGEENARSALFYVLKEVLGQDCEAAPPAELAWQGIYYPGVDEIMDSAGEYRKKCPGYQPERPTVGILFYRSLWINKNYEIIDSIIRECDGLGLNALPAFATGSADADTGSLGNRYVINEYFMQQGQPVIDALIDLQSSMLIKPAEQGATGDTDGFDLLQRMNVPIIKGLTTYSKTEEEWRADKYGISGASMVWAVGMPEMNGVIEPIVIACQERSPQPDTGGALEYHRPLAGRICYLCRRVKKWIDLKNKPVDRRKVAFILHNNPCVGAELSVGGGANLDTLESVARIMKEMQSQGYSLQELPQNGEELIHTIMDRKAISDFRWTPIEEIVQKGGVLRYLKTDEYRRWFNGFPSEARQAMTATWGNPPGEEIDEVPAAMVYQGDILITGVEYGNAVICAQPKRGCAGPRCDGRVCKILHDPECPPTHQYVATYRYLEDVWGADALVHVGTHGNLEFLPGKALGLSESCYPELTLGTLPHLYIYNTDNPAEGTIAKRRSYATLVGHMQTVMVETAAYGAYDDLAAMLGEYQQACTQDKTRANALEHLIAEKITQANLTVEIDLNQDFPAIVEKTHAVLNRMKSSMHQDGMHIFDSIPQGEGRVNFIHSVLRHDTEESRSFGRLVAELMGLDYDALHETPHVWHEAFGKTYGDLLQEIHICAKSFIREFITVNGRG